MTSLQQSAGGSEARYCPALAGMAMLRPMQAEDRRLLKACLEGRREAWDELVERYSPYVYFLIHATFRKHHRHFDDGTVEEIHNTVFLAILEDDMRRLRSFRGENGCTLRSWLRIITINRSIDHLKSLRTMLSLDATDEDGISLGDSLSDGGPSAEEMMQRVQAPEAAAVISTAVMGLSPADRELYDKLFDEGLDAAEVAETLGISVGAVYTRKCRMLDRMSRAVKEAGLLDEGEGRGTA